jgi:hypothetical protein
MIPIPQDPGIHSTKFERTGASRLLASACSLLATIVSLSVQANTHFVDLNNPTPLAPFDTWSTAATNIQDAVDATVDGDIVLVTNGIYAVGGRRWFDSGTNRVTLTNVITLRSVNGPAVTWIVGNRVAGVGTALTNATRCVYMANTNAVLSGFTLTNGSGGFGNYPGGGGVTGGTVTNCLLVGNLATNSTGGGALRSILIDCQLVGNSASSGGGACACTLTRCTIVSNNAASGGGIYGGGVFGASVLSNCVLAGNTASSTGGGAFGSTLIACSISNNTAGAGGGAHSSLLNNCLIVANRAADGGGMYAGGATNCTLALNVATNTGGGIDGASGTACQNSILYFNSAPTGSNYTGTKFNYCCIQPIDSSNGTSITNDPSFIDLASGDFHLQSNSPCINSGNNSFVTRATDLGALARIAGGTVDIGAYEYPTPSSIISYAWLLKNGLPIDGSADGIDADGDGMNTWQEWIADTSPTNALSKLAVQSVSPATSGGGLTVKWPGSLNRSYYLQRSTNLAQAGSFSSIASNIFSGSGTATFIDRAATNAGPYFYRVGVQ